MADNVRFFSIFHSISTGNRHSITSSLSHLSVISQSSLSRFSSLVIYRGVNCLTHHRDSPFFTNHRANIEFVLFFTYHRASPLLTYHRASPSLPTIELTFLPTIELALYLPTIELALYLRTYHRASPSLPTIELSPLYLPQS